MARDELGRRPDWVYGVGVEPDPRFTLANERTFLGWIRTSLALAALGYALRVLQDSELADVVGRVLLVAAALSSLGAWWRWARFERALRLERGLPSSVGAPVLAVGLAVGLTLLAVLVLR